MSIKLDEQELFDIKQKFLREIPHPILIQKQIDRLSKKAEDSFGHQEVEFSQRELESFLKEYTLVLMPIKLSVSNAQTGEALRRALSSLLFCQNKLISKLSEYVIAFNSEKFKDIKMSTTIDVYAIQKFISENSLKESEINAYLCSAFEKADSESISILTESVVRAKKIEDYGKL
ncbi:MAG: hypothetical protein ACI857_000958 [Arenicella sp.]